MRSCTTYVFKCFILVLILGTRSFLSNAQQTTEKFNPRLARLNSIEVFNSYIDSLEVVRNINPKSKAEVLLINELIEDRFYHAYCRYSVQDNFIAFLAGEYLWDHLSAIVIPDDILKHPEAACSQQSIVMMALLKKRGYKVRKLGLTGHFVLETFYNNKWRVFDPNKEPVMQGFAHDSIESHLKNGNLNRAYASMSEQEVQNMYQITSIGKINEFPAKNARLFHIVTKFLSQYFLLFVAGFLVSVWRLVRYKKLRKKKKILISSFEKMPQCQERALAN